MRWCLYISGTTWRRSWRACCREGRRELIDTYLGLGAKYLVSAAYIEVRREAAARRLDGFLEEGLCRLSRTMSAGFPE